MNKSWISNLQTLIAKLKKENLETDENLNLLLDFEQELFNLCKAITISSDKSIEKVYEDISLLSCHFIISRFLQKKHFNGTEKNLNETRNKIQKTFKSLNELEIISEDINDWYCSDKISPRENYNLEEYNFSSFLKGENPEKLEKYLLSFILIFSQNMPDFLQFSDDIINFLKMMVSASSEKELMEITNTTIIKYWSNYIELNGEYKTSMYERKAFLTKKISEMENSLSNFLIIQNSKTVFIDDLLEVYSYWLLFETDEESRNKISSAYKLLLRIFNNEYQITINKIRIEILKLIRENTHL